MRFKKPKIQQVIEMLDMIVGETCEVTEAAVDTAKLAFTATYVDNSDQAVATCSCTFSTAAALGCALSMIPPGGAECMVEDKELTKTAAENLYEVMNIFSSLMMDDRSEHLRVLKVDEGTESRLQGEGFSEESFHLSLGKYGPGELIFSYC